MDIYRTPIFITLLILLAIPSLAHAQETEPPQPPTSVPAFQSIPPLIGPVSLSLPWQCGSCAPGAASLQPIEAELDWKNPFSGWSWLGAQLWNRVALPIICWMLAALQALLNAAAWAINMVFVGGVNFVWRLLVYMVYMARGTFYNFWWWVGWIRSLLWEVWRWLVQFPEYIMAWIRLAGELLGLLGELLLELGRMIISAAQALLYLLAMLVNIAGALVTAIISAEPPPQLDGIANNIFLVMFVDTIRGIADSKLWWAWQAFIALTYGRFGLWLLNETSQVNS